MEKLLRPSESVSFLIRYLSRALLLRAPTGPEVPVGPPVLPRERDGALGATGRTWPSTSKTQTTTTSCATPQTEEDGFSFNHPVFLLRDRPRWPPSRHTSSMWMMSSAPPSGPARTVYEGSSPLWTPVPRSNAALSLRRGRLSIGA